MICGLEGQKATDQKQDNRAGQRYMDRDDAEDGQKQGGGKRRDGNQERAAALFDRQLALSQGKQAQLRQCRLHHLSSALKQQHVTHLQHQVA